MLPNPEIPTPIPRSVKPLSRRRLRPLPSPSRFPSMVRPGIVKPKPCFDPAAWFSSSPSWLRRRVRARAPSCSREASRTRTTLSDSGSNSTRLPSPSTGMAIRIPPMRFARTPGIPSAPVSLIPRSSRHRDSLRRRDFRLFLFDRHEILHVADQHLLVGLVSPLHDLGGIRVGRVAGTVVEHAGDLDLASLRQ